MPCVFTGLPACSPRGLTDLGHRLIHDHFFDTLCVHCGPDTERLLAAADAAGINLRRVDSEHLGISVGESTTRAHIGQLLEIFAGDGTAPAIEALDEGLDPAFSAIPAELQRSTPTLSHEIFSRYHSETEMLRYLKRLENRDLSLAHAMIPAGFLHHEAQRHRGNDTGDLARVWAACIRLPRRNRPGVIAR